MFGPNKNIINSFFLFICLVLLLIASPILEEVDNSGVGFSILWSFVIVASVLNASPDIHKRVMAIILAVLWLITTFIPTGVHIATPSLIAALLFIFTIRVILMKIFNAYEVDADILNSSLTVYLLFGMAWTSVYMALYHINSQAFHVLSGTADFTSVDFIYFSFITLTTLGYGDIIPVSPIAKMLAATEAVTGVLYLTVLVAKLVSLYKRSH